MIVALIDAAHGVVNVRALTIGASYVWTGGALALAAGTLLRTPPQLPDEAMFLEWTALVLVIVLIATVVLRRQHVEDALPKDVRRRNDGRYVGLGAVAAAVVLIAYAYL